MYVCLYFIPVFGFRLLSSKCLLLCRCLAGCNPGCFRVVIPALGLLSSRKFSCCHPDIWLVVIPMFGWLLSRWLAVVISLFGQYTCTYTCIFQRQTIIVKKNEERKTKSIILQCSNVIKGFRWNDKQCRLRSDFSLDWVCNVCS